MTSSGLITDSDLASLSSVVDQLVVDIQGHTNLGIVGSHQNITVENTPVFDNNSTPYDDSPNSPLGNKVGDVSLVIEANGYRYRIPASLSPTGPVKMASSISVSPTEAFSLAPEGAAQPSVLVRVDFNATQPTTVTWETVVGTTWVPINASYCYANGVQYTPTTGHHTYGYNGIGSTCDIHYVGGSASKSVGDMTISSPTTTSGLAAAQYSILTLPFNSDNTSGRIALGQIRAKISNSSVGGGTKYSVVVPCYLEDKTGSWICGAVNEVSTIHISTKATLLKFRLWCIEHHPEDTNTYLGNAGSQLVRRMRNQNVDFSKYHKKISDILEQPTSEESFVAYKQMVLECMGQYWPDYDIHAIVQQQASDVIRPDLSSHETKE